MRVLAVMFFLAMPALTWAGTTEYRLSVPGVPCPFCTYGLEKKLLDLPGSTEFSFDLQHGTARLVLGADAEVEPSSVAAAVAEAGFSADAMAFDATGVLRAREGGLALHLPGGLVLPLAPSDALQGSLDQTLTLTIDAVPNDSSGYTLTATIAP